MRVIGLRQLTHGLLITLLLLTLTVTSAAQDVSGDLLGRINALRGSLGLAGYQWNGALAAAAQSHAQWMADSSSISHTGPGGSTPSSRAAAAGYGSSWVSENIYGGTNATTDSAWNFWINSPIHYRGLTNVNYREIGIGYAVGSGMRTYVLVFGNPGGTAWQPQPTPRSSDSGGDGGSTGSGRSSAPPVFVVGLDNQGNIMHEIQAGHTLGDIALMYGYGWDDIPAMLELNQLSEAEGRILPVGGIFLVPPLAGTYTPTPFPEGYVPPTLPPEQIVETAVAYAALQSTYQVATERAAVLLTPVITLGPTDAAPAVTLTPPDAVRVGAIATSGQVPPALLTPTAPVLTASPTPTEAALLVDAGGGPPLTNPASNSPASSPPTLLLLAALGLMGLIVGGLLIEALRR